MSGWWTLGLMAVLALAFWRWVLLPTAKIRERIRRLTEAESLQDSFGIAEPLPFLYRGLSRDLSALEGRMVEMQRQLSDESLNLRTILGSMVEGVLIVDSNQHIRLINTGMQALVPAQPQVMNRTIMEVFRNHELQRAVRETLDESGAVRREIPLDVWAGDAYTHKFFEITSVPLHQAAQSDPIGAIVVFHDITRLKELETIRSEFVANVSHELRTPLSIITGYLETLMDGALESPEEARRFCQTMLRHASRLNLLIEDLMMLSRLESRALELRREPVEIGHACERVIQALEPKINAKSARFSILIDPDVPVISLDPQRFDQVLFNLFDNALKYSSTKKLEVEIRAAWESEHLVLTVSDNGPGIPLEDQSHIFERFYRVHKDRSRDAGGTGLGLSIVKHIVQNHGGTVALESTPGEGAAFIVRLPPSTPDEPLQKKLS